MGNNKYDALYYFNKFSAIPESKWKVGGFGTRGDGPHCALGHVDIHNYTDETVGLIDLFTRYHENKGLSMANHCWGGVANINDLGALSGTYGSRTGKDAKESILCVLAEILMQDENGK